VTASYPANRRVGHLSLWKTISQFLLKTSHSHELQRIIRIVFVHADGFGQFPCERLLGVSVTVKHFELVEDRGKDLAITRREGKAFLIREAGEIGIGSFNGGLEE
jgi:hypothetical protein